MAKNINDDNEEHGKGPAVFRPATKPQLREMLDKYEEHNDSKKVESDAQKDLLRRYNDQHSLPPWISKIVRKFDKLEQDDSAEASRSERALLHALDALKIGSQSDLEDFTNGEGHNSSKADDEEWEKADPKKAKKKELEDA